MKKKLIALTIATLTSGTALAQSSVSIYGSVDVGVSYRSNNVYEKYDNLITPSKNIGSQTAIDSGIASENYLGFKGSEDLGNGLKALFQLEAAFAVDTGEHTMGGRLFGRQATVGLTGGFGTALAGRMEAPYYTFLSSLDPFKAGTVGRYNNVYGGDVSFLFDTVRLDNAVAYVSPDFSGFNVTVAYSSNAIDQDRIGNSKKQNRTYAILPRYTNGPIDLGFSYHIIETDQTFGSFGPYDDVKNWTIGGAYDFKVLKLSAFYSDTKATPVRNADPFFRNMWDMKVKSYMIGAAAPFGRHTVMFSYNHSEAEVWRLSGEADQWAVGWTYDLSKRTSLYAAYANIDNDYKGRRVYIRRASVGDASNGENSGYQEGLQFGVKHTF